MKFLTLREALDKVLPPPKPVSPVNKNKPSNPPRINKQLVVGGDVIWKPVNKQAAMIVAKAPWWAFDVTSKTHTTHKMNTEPKQKLTQLTPMNSPSGVNIRETSRGIEEVRPLKHDELSAAISERVISGTRSSLDSTNKLLNEALDARAALDVMSEKWKADWIDFIQSSNDRLKEFRAFRMALDSEMRQVLVAARDVRKFFMENEHQQEVERLKEFVDLCERMQKLRDSGFLDNIADTILKLSGTSQ